jgi:branched-chain amino acid transport system ATP-binding protein
LAQALIEALNLEVHYGGIVAVKGISFAVEENEIVCLIGANGAGKTSTLKALARMIPSQRRNPLRQAAHRCASRP